MRTRERSRERDVQRRKRNSYLEDCARAVVRSSLEIQLVHRTLNTKQGLCFSPLSGCCCDEPRNSRDHPHCPSRKLRERAVRSVRSELCVLVGEAHRIRGAVANLRSPMPLLLDLEDREFADERILVASLSLPLVVLCRNACDCCFAHSEKINLILSGGSLIY